MREPIARSTSRPVEPEEVFREPRAVPPTAVQRVEPEADAFADLPVLTLEPEPRFKRAKWLGRLLWGAMGLIASLALGLAADSLIRELYRRAEWLGWVGLGALALFVLAALALAIREAWALRRLHGLEHLRHAAAQVLVSDQPDPARAIVQQLSAVYAGRADMARARTVLDADAATLFDGADIVRHAERTLMLDLDARAKALTAASARRVAVVTAVSPRALIDMGYVIFESLRLGGTIAQLYGARPGFFGSLRLVGAILAHLAVTGGILLTDGFVEQLVGQGAAARISARLGEGFVNGLMTARVGIAAMRAVRPLPFAALQQPMVRDFIPELVNLTKGTGSPS
ncbi:MAG: rane protein [Devosia sp.]|nr:rane protein [Devosia sp.]